MSENFRPFAGYRIRYESVEKLCIISDSGVVAESLRPLIGYALRFVQEPENAYDHSAVAVYYQYQKLGYVYSYGSKDDINSHIEKKLPIFGWLSYIDDGDAYFGVRLYVPENEYIKVKYKLYKPTKHISDCCLDEYVHCEYDEKRRSYCIRNYGGDLLGFVYDDGCLCERLSYEGKIVEYNVDKGIYRVELTV